MTGYTDTIRRYAMDSSRSGELPDADGIGEVGLGADEAGKRLAVRFAIRSRKSVVDDIRFQVFGCGFTIAACAAAAELATGHPLDEVARIDAARVDAVLEGLPAERSYCAELAVAALQAAVKSARSEDHAVRQAVHQPDAHGPRVTADDPVYRALMQSPAPPGVAAQDRHLFACLLAVAAGEPHELASAAGLSREDLRALLALYFPTADPGIPPEKAASSLSPPPESNPDVLAILLSHVPADQAGRSPSPSRWLARAIAARAAHPGHLWIAMGLFERPEISAAIRRHLPTLAAANHQGMRWKRYLFKQVCDLHGGVMCKSPNCGVCSDYTLCFPVE